MICANMIAFGISSKATVSYDAEVEYLESTGTQWIDTGHIPTINTKWDITCASTLLPLASNNGIGVYRASNKMRLSTTTGNGSEIPAGFYFSTGSFSEYYYGIYDNDKHDITFNNSCGTSTAYVSFDGTTIHEFGVINSLEEGASIYLFAYNGTRGPAPSKFKIYSSKIYENGVLVQDLIPVIDNNGVACMYDNVSKQCFYNQGVGEFVAGPVVEKQYLKFTAEEANSTISMSANGSAPTVYLETSTTGDEGSWSDFTVGSTTITLANVGDKIYFRAKQDNNVFATSTSNYNNFVMTGKIASSGNPNTLLKADGSVIDLTGRNYCYTYMFRDCTALTQPPKLPAATLAQRCYQGMFTNCTSLTQAPVLPATTLARYCYHNMFRDCTALTQPPKLPATTLATYCYAYMFHNCTSLTKAPELPATTLATQCYANMFNGCTSLTKSPALPATTLANYCYYHMFEGCTSLTQAPELPAETLAVYCYRSMFHSCALLTQPPELPAATLTNYCYYSMFEGCTSLTQAPELPAETLAVYCYHNMFNGCTNLNNINVNFSAWYPSDATTGWVQNVSSSGTFTCPEELPETYGTAYIPEGWTIQRK